MMTMTPGEAEFLQDMREARAAREAAGITEHRLDPVWEAAERGEFPPHVRGSRGDEDQQAYENAMAIAKGLSADVADRPTAGSAASNQFGTFAVKWASEAQTRYIASLMRRKDLSAAAERGAEIIRRANPQIEAKQINKKHASAVLDVLTGLPDKPESRGNAAKGDPNAGRRPNRFGGKCVGCGGYVKAEAGWLAKDAAGKWAAEHKDSCPPKAEVKPVYEWTINDSGIYQNPATGTIFKVYCTIHGSRQMAAKELVTRVNLEKGDHPQFMVGEFSYRGLAERFVQPEWVMDIEAAKQLGQVYGFCCVCGTSLTDEQSIQEGIGPVCGGRVKRRGVQFRWAAPAA